MRHETAGDRFRATIDLFRVGVSLKEAQLRAANPSLGDAEVLAMLKAWLVDKQPPGGEELRRVPWPRRSTPSKR